MPELEAVPLDLDEAQLEDLRQQVDDALRSALEAHTQREQKLAQFKQAYKAQPEHEKKNFPWPGASNVVIPIVPITVDTVVARLMKSFLGTKDPIEAIIKDPAYESLEKDFRDWSSMFLDKSGARSQLRTTFHDLCQDGTSYVKVLWESRERTVHAYDSLGGVQSIQIPEYEGPVWRTISSNNVVFPTGYDEWAQLPWQAERLFFDWRQLKEAEAAGMYELIDDELRRNGKPRDDKAHRTTQDTSKVRDTNKDERYTFYEIWGKWVIAPAEGQEAAEPDIRELILTYCLEDRRFHRKIHNPFFGHARHIVRIPFLHQPHEIEGLGLAEMSIPFQVEASTAHNQSIDAATAAIAGIVVCSPEANLQAGEEIYPGKTIKTPKPKEDVNVVHFSQGNSNLPNVEQQAAFWNEKRTGVSAYNMGVESPVAGSRATATGTTALISEGNIRFWVSIDDMRDAIVDLVYLTLQLEQQYRKDGTPISESRMLVLPQADLRSVFGLRLAISSEKVNQELEIQALMQLTQILNEYYARLMQVVGMIINPMIPQAQVMIAVQVMEASANLVTRIVERFDIEGVEMLIPRITQALEIMRSVGSQPMAGPINSPAGAIPQGVPGGPPALPPGAGPSGINGGPPPGPR